MWVKEPLGFNLDVRGKLNSIKVLDVEPANERLDLSINDGMVLLNHVHLEPGKCFQLLFLWWFEVHYERRVYDWIGVARIVQLRSIFGA